MQQNNNPKLQGFTKASIYLMLLGLWVSYSSAGLGLGIRLQLRTGFSSAPGISHPKTSQPGTHPAWDEGQKVCKRHLETHNTCWASAQKCLSTTSSHIPLAQAGHRATPKVNAAGMSAIPLCGKVTQ